MARKVICPGCGHRQTLEDDFARNKVRCPECGVMCAVPGPSPEKSAAPKGATPKAESEEDLAARMLGEVEAPAPAATPMPRKPALPPAPKKGAAPAPPPPTPKPQQDGEDDDDGKPYLVDGPEERKCPECARVIESDAMVCLACGLDLRKGKKLKRTYEPLERSWDLGIQMPQRKLLFALCSLLGIGMSVGHGVYHQSWLDFAIPAFIFVAMLAFLLGTFFHMDLSRDQKGRVKLTKTWRIFFVKQAPKDIDVMEYLGVRTGVSSDAGFLEWLICLDLATMGLIPGVVFWYQVIHKDRHHVELTREHGYADQIVYRGNDGELAREVMAALRDAGQLREETS